MSERRPNQVTHNFPKVNVTYEPPKNFLQRFKPASRRPTIEIETEPEATPSPSCEPPRSSWFQRLDIEHNHGTCTAPSHVIDVQPDFRHPLAYILYSVRELYGPVVLKQTDNRVSLLTLVFYCQTLVVATLLFYDMYSRPFRSCSANSFLQGSRRSDFCEFLFELRVPNFMSQILSFLSPAFDAHQPRLLFIPTLAGFSFRHDFGRLVPPAIFLAAQSVSCERKPDYGPMELLRSLYATKIISIGGKDYYVTNFVGGPYMDEGEVCDHTNWIRPTIESFLMSNGANDYAYCQYFPLTYEHESSINPYELMFCFDSGNQSNNVRSILKSISHFFQEKEPLSQTLGSVLSSPSGITIMSHFYASPTLPTCHSLPPPPAVYKTEHSFIDDVQFAAKSRFLSTPTDEAEANRVRFSPLGHERFDQFTHVRGDIFGFQPYGQDLASLGAAVTLGLTIENGDIDGVTISQPNLRLSLCDNNSRLLQGSLPRRVVRAYIPDFKAGNELVLLKRSGQSARPNNPVGFARCDMGQIVLRNSDQLSDIPFDVNGSYYTYMAWNRSDEILPIPDSSLYFWSSYRHVSKDCEYPDIHFYYTLKALYGNVVSMTSLNNPSWLFPG